MTDFTLEDLDAIEAAAEPVDAHYERLLQDPFLDEEDEPLNEDY